MSQLTRIRAIAASRVGVCTDEELCDILVYRHTSGDESLSPKGYELSEQKLKQMISFFKAMLLEEYGQLPDTNFGTLN